MELDDDNDDDDNDDDDSEPKTLHETQLQKHTGMSLYMQSQWKCPWVENKEAIKEHKTWRLRLKRKVSGLKDHPVSHHVTCRVW